MSLITRRTSQKDSNKIPSSRGLGHRQCLIIDHATHSGLFYAPWNLIARFTHGTRTGWFSHKKQRVESAEQSQSPLFPEVALSGQEMSTLFEESGGGGDWGLTSPTPAIGTFPQAGALQVGYTTFLCISTRHRFYDGCCFKMDSVYLSSTQKQHWSQGYFQNMSVSTTLSYS